MDYFVQVGVLIGIYGILTVSLDLLVGHTGVLFLAHGAFYGVGAYTAALLSRWLPNSFVANAIAAVIVSSALAFVLISPALKVRGEQLVLATFAIQVILTSLMLNYTKLTGGPLGIALGRSGSSASWLRPPESFLLITIPCLALACVSVVTLTSESYGRALHAMREDELFAQTRGRNTFRYRREVVCVSAGLAGLAGALYASVFGFVDPTGFSFSESLLIISMVIIGGAGRIGGSLLGAAMLILLGESLRFLGLPSSAAANVRQIIYGSALVLVLMVRPRGLIGRFGFGQ